MKADYVLMYFWSFTPTTNFVEYRKLCYLNMTYVIRAKNHQRVQNEALVHNGSYASSLFSTKRNLFLTNCIARQNKCTVNYQYVAQIQLIWYPSVFEPFRFICDLLFSYCIFVSKWLWPKNNFTIIMNILHVGLHWEMSCIKLTFIHNS